MLCLSLAPSQLPNFHIRFLFELKKLKEKWNEKCHTFITISWAPSYILCTHRKAMRSSSLPIWNWCRAIRPVFKILYGTIRTRTHIYCFSKRRKKNNSFASASTSTLHTLKSKNHRSQQFNDHYLKNCLIVTKQLHFRCACVHVRNSTRATHTESEKKTREKERFRRR